MRFDVISLFPEMFATVRDSGVTGRAHAQGRWALHAWNPRDATHDAHRTVDGRLYGGDLGMVMKAEPFEVRDAKTGEDLTRSILLQIILEEESNETPMFTAPVLASVIRFYGHAMQGFMGGYLEKNIQALVDLQRTVIPATIPNPLANPLGNNVFLQMQEHMQKQTEQFLSTFGPKR